MGSYSFGLSRSAPYIWTKGDHSRVYSMGRTQQGREDKSTEGDMVLLNIPYF